MQRILIIHSLILTQSLLEDWHQVGIRPVRSGIIAGVHVTLAIVVGWIRSGYYTTIFITEERKHTGVTQAELSASVGWIDRQCEVSSRRETG